MFAPASAQSTEPNRDDVSRPSIHPPLWKDLAFWGLLVVVGCLYLARLTTFPIHGEESRWANSATEMLQSGDWVVPRQQDQIFPERPPMNVWLMAVGGIIRGEVDVWAIRIPSVFAIIVTSGFLYYYTRHFLTVAGALAAGGIYATLGQVMQIGRLGESEAVLAMFITLSLLSFHLGYQRRWGIWRTASLAYLFAGLAALTKGLQGPVYLAVASTLFLFVQRDWRWWLSWRHLVGIVTGLSVVLIWQVPFYLATDLQAVKDVWTGLVLDRVTLSGLLEHVAVYPLETIACLMPWSLMLVQLISRDFRTRLGSFGSWFGFALLATVAAYPSVWLVAGARGRYFMPLYGCIAVILAVIVQTSFVGREGSWALRGWIRYARLSSLGMFAAAMVLIVSSLSGIEVSGIKFDLAASLFLLCAAGVGIYLAWKRPDVESNPMELETNDEHPDARFGIHSRVSQQVLLTTLCLGLTYVAIAPSVALKHGHHVRENAEIARRLLPADQQWISFGPVHHRLVYHLGKSVKELPWPESAESAPADGDYFLLDYNTWDTPEVRLSGRGRKWGTTPGTLPFEWEEVMRIPMDRSYLESDSWVIVGRIKHPGYPDHYPQVNAIESGNSTKPAEVDPVNDSELRVGDRSDRHNGSAR